MHASRHAILRFAAGVSGALVLCEWLQWTPTFLAPVLTAVLISNLPGRPAFKMALGLVVVMAVASLVPFLIAVLLRGKPWVLFGMITLCMFVTFYAMLIGRPRVPALLMLICLAVVPVVVMVAPASAGMLPLALVRAMALALAAIATVHVLWPAVPPRAPEPAPPALTSSALSLALLSTAVVLPLMLAYLLLGLADALPVIVTTVMLVVNFDPQRSRMHALALILGNFAGGMLGWLMHAALLTTPHLIFLAVLLFVVLLGFGQAIARGGPKAAVALVACNAMLIIFSSAIASGPGSLSVWLVRLLQFALAGAFAVGMMSLLWHRAPIGRAVPPAAVRRG